MSERSTRHDSFVLERTYPAAPARVFAAWAEPTAKARWFVGPGDWRRSRYELDFRVGGRERLSGGPPGGEVHAYDARYWDIVPDRRIVYAYDMHLDARRISVSLATVVFEPAGAGTRLVFTEQAVFLDGHEGVPSRELGTRALLENLGVALGGGGGGEEPAGDRDIVNTRLLDAPRERVFRAWTEPAHLARWWGPKGFTSTFQVFEPRPGGAWRFVMHGPDGKDYPNESVFEVVRPDLIVFHHLSGHHFELTATLAAQGDRTRLTFRMRFDSAAERDRVKEFVVDANEQNLDRLEAELSRMA
jgi:uncharacterized protein YndB with AHSA1/START domain